MIDRRTLAWLMAAALGLAAASAGAQVPPPLPGGLPVQSESLTQSSSAVWQA
jgi:hypothetical protein